jgi:hypothetical protein
MIRVRYLGSNELSPGLHATAERQGRQTTIFLLDGMTVAERRSALRRLRLTARMGHCPRLPAGQLGFALFTDQIRTGIRRAGAVLRLHPAGSTVPIMVLSGGAIAFLLLSTVSIHVLRPPRATDQSAAGISPVISASAIAIGGSRGQATGPGGPGNGGNAGNAGNPAGTGGQADPGALGRGSGPGRLPRPHSGPAGTAPAPATSAPATPAPATPAPGAPAPATSAPGAGNGAGSGSGSGTGGSGGDATRSSGTSGSGSGGTTDSSGTRPSQVASQPSTPATAATAPASAATAPAAAPTHASSSWGSPSSGSPGGVCGCGSAWGLPEPVDN